MDRLLLNLKAGEIMNHEFYTAGLNTTLDEIIKIILKHKTNSVIITSKSKKVLGIITRRNISECLNTGMSNNTRAENIMVRDVLTISTHQEAKYARDLMIKHKIGQLPVT
ncbi:MAG: HPP family protein [Clostridiaceae bacterium]